MALYGLVLRLVDCVGFLALVIGALRLADKVNVLRLLQIVPNRWHGRHV